MALPIRSATSQRSLAATLAVLAAALVACTAIAPASAEARGAAKLLRDIVPGKDSGIQRDAKFLRSAIEVRGKLVFMAHDRRHGTELWASDGTRRGTGLLRDVYKGAKGSKPRIHGLAGGTMYFSACDRKHGCELWRTDGTRARTRLVSDIRPGNENGSPFMGRYGDADYGSIGKVFFFVACDGTSGCELWRTNGVRAETERVADIVPGSGSPRIGEMESAGGRLFFTACEDDHGCELWASDGTGAGTALFHEFRPGPEPAASGFNYQEPIELTGVDGFLYLTACATDTGCEAWRTDGTEAGTILLRDARPGPEPANHDPEYGLFFSRDYTADKVAPGSVLFTGCDDERGCELWRSDEPTQGTDILRDIEPATSKVGGVSSQPRSLTTVGKRVYFAATTRRRGEELWRSAGTTSGTRLVEDIVRGRDGAGPLNLTRLGRRLAFTASTGSGIGRSGGREPWITNGKGTKRLANIHRGKRGSNPWWLAEAGGRLFIAATDGRRGHELWVARR